jgi:hypothetical protein
MAMAMARRATRVTAVGDMGIPGKAHSIPFCVKKVSGVEFSGQNGCGILFWCDCGMLDGSRIMSHP